MHLLHVFSDSLRVRQVARSMSIWQFSSFVLISAEIKGGRAKLILINPVEVAGFVSCSEMFDTLLSLLWSLMGVTNAFGVSSKLKL